MRSSNRPCNDRKKSSPASSKSCATRIRANWPRSADERSNRAGPAAAEELKAAPARTLGLGRADAIAKRLHLLVLAIDRLSLLHNRRLAEINQFPERGLSVGESQSRVPKHVQSPSRQNFVPVFGLLRGCHLQAAEESALFPGRLKVAARPVPAQSRTRSKACADQIPGSSVPVA